MSTTSSTQFISCIRDLINFNDLVHQLTFRIWIQSNNFFTASKKYIQRVELLETVFFFVQILRKMKEVLISGSE